MARPRHPMSTALLKYARHKALAKFRGIDFKFQFQEWYDWWLSHGVDKNQNVKWPGPLRPCMCRYHDQGAYEIGNVYYATNSDNARDHGQSVKQGVKAKPSGKPHSIIYRWGDQRVKFDFLQAKGIDYYTALHHFREMIYDRQRLVEHKKLKLRYIEQHGTQASRRRYSGANDQWYHQLKSAAASLGIAGDTYRRRLRRGIYQMIYLGPTFQEFAMANSKYPDPIV